METTAVPNQAMVAASQATRSRSALKTMAVRNGEPETMAHAVHRLKIMWLHLRFLKYASSQRAQSSSSLTVTAVEDSIKLAALRATRLLNEKSTTDAGSTQELAA